jgi:hypothetical protein
MNYDKYFNHDSIVKVDLEYYYNAKLTLSNLRKIGNNYNQYVIGIRYLDYVILNIDDYEYCYYNTQTFEKLYFNHSNCDECNNFLNHVKNNNILVAYIYPKNEYPEYYINRKNKWDKLKNEIFDKKNKWEKLKN